MNAIHTTLTTSGNSTAVRLPKELLALSGLTKEVMLEVADGKIIISKAVHTRQDWDKKIEQLSTELDTVLNDMDVAAHDGLDELPWNGPSFEEWERNEAKFS